MDYRFPQASSSRSEQPSTSRASGSIMPFPGSNPRTSSKRSFDEYGHLESRSTSGPSGNSSMMTTPTSSAVGAPAMLGLGNTSSIGNPFGDPVNNAHNTRNKRRRGSLSPPQAEGSLHVPSMPVGTSLSTSASGQRGRGHSASNSAESLMSWMDDTASQETLHQSIGQMTTQVTETASVLNGGQHQTSRNLNNGDSLYESRPDGEVRDNRMSWMPDNSQATDTVTTNTEPGWNFAPHNQNLGPAMDFTMPHTQSTDALNQPPPQFLERNSFEPNNERNGPQMPTPSFRPNIHPATSDFDNHTSPNLISPRSPSSLYMDAWYRSHDSRPSHPIVPPSPIESPPSPPAWRDPPPPSQSQPQPVQPSPAESSSWPWPFNRWSFDGGLSPTPPAPQVTPRVTQETRSNATSGRPSTMHSFVAENRPDYWSGPAQSSRPNFTRAGDSARVEAPPPWPPYHIHGSSETTPPRRLLFPEPQSQSAGRNNGYTSYPRDDHSMHRSGPRILNETSHAVGPSSSSFSTFGNPSGTAGSRPRDPHALPMPSDMSSSRHSASLYPSAGDRGMRSHEEPARSRTSGRAPSPSPTPARRTIRALHDIWDRDARNRNSGLDFDDWRPYSSRSNSDSSPVDPYHPYSPIDPQQRRADRLEHWRDEINLGPGDRGDPFQRFERFGMERSTGPLTNRPRNIRPEPRNRPPNSFYDHPSMGDLISRHSNHPQERERRELHSSMASLARTPGPPPATRRPPSGLSDYTRGGNAGSSVSASTGRPIPSPSPTRAPPRSNSPVSSRPFPPLPSSHRPPSPASRPSPFFLDHFSHSSANEPSERPSESRSASLRTTRQSRRRERESRMSRLLGPEHPLAFLGSDEEFPYYDSFNVNLDDPELSGLSITTAERIRALSRFRAGRRALGAVPTGRMRALGDYVMDDDWDGSYETLLALSQNAVKRGCSEGTLDGLPHGTYSEFAAGGSEENKVLGDNGNCAICLEDYVPADSCIKLPRCMHFYHKDCVKEWLKTAKTCPVCRENVEGAPRVTGNSRSTRVRFGPISDMHREPQNAAVEYLRQTSGAGPATVPTPRPPRRRSTNEGRPIPPPPSMFQDVERETRSSALDRMRRIRMADALLEGPLLSDFNDPWPAFSPPSPPSHPFSLYGRSPSPPFMDAPGTSSRFARGAALARALGEGSIDDVMRASNYN